MWLNVSQIALQLGLHTVYTFNMHFDEKQLHLQPSALHGFAYFTIAFKIASKQPE